MISKKNKIIFVHVPKTGGSSIEKCLVNIFDENISVNGDQTIVKGVLKKPKKNSFNSLKHATAEELKLQYGEEIFNDYVKFSVVRNPWDRLLSLYYWSAGKSKPYNKKLFINNFLPKEPDNSPRSVWTLNKYLCDKEDNLLVDNLINFDDLNNSFNDFCVKISLGEKKLPHINARKTQKFGYKDIMDKEVIEMIGEYYKKEINKFWNE
jgi:hypothetical protein